MTFETFFTEDGWTPSSIPYLEGAVVFTIVVYIWETYLDYRQYKMLKVDKFPEKLRVAIASVDEDRKAKSKENNDKEPDSLLKVTEEKFEKSRLYGMDKSRYGFVHSLYTHVEGIALVFLGYIPFMWVVSGQILTFYGFDASHEIYRAMVFVMITSLRDTIIQLPFDLYFAFVVEEKHGFNKQTLALFFTDRVKSIAITAVIGLPLLAAIIYVIQWGGEYFYVYMWALLFVFSIIMITIYPVLIMPLFNKFTPLEQGTLRNRIEELAGSLKFPLTKLYVCDGSKRSSHSNAYFFGMFKSKRIVLFDTLLEQASDDEIVGILGHELGHWKLWHTYQNFVISQLHTITMFYVFGRCMNDEQLFSSFGFDSSSKPVIIGLILFSQAIWAPIEKLLSFLMTVNTRRNEFQADEFAFNLGYGKEIQSGLTKISIENLANMNPDPLYSAFHYSHPPLVERLTAIEELSKKSK